MFLGIKGHPVQENEGSEGGSGRSKEWLEEVKEGPRR